MHSRGRGRRGSASSSTVSWIPIPPPIPHTSSVEENATAPQIPIPPPIPHTSSVEENRTRFESAPTDSESATVGSEAPSVTGSMMEKDDRLTLIVVGTSISPSNQASQKMRLAFMSHLSPGATTWRQVPKHIKQIYWEEFQKNCKWDPALDQQIYELFMRKGTSRYRALIHELKRSWLDEKPKLSGIPDLVWKRLVAHWYNSEVQKKAYQNSKNRRSEPLGPGTGISIHRGGSRAAVDHAIAIEKETGAPAKEWSVFCKFHPDGNTYAVPKKIVEEVTKKASILTQAALNDDEIQEIDMNQLFMDTTVQTKGRILGIGNMAQTCSLHTNSTSYVSLASRDEMHQRFEEVKKKEIILEEKMQVLESKMNEVDEMRSQLKVLMDMVARGQMPFSGPSS